MGLTWKLQRNIFIGWLIGVLVMVATIGSLVPQMSDIYADSDQLVAMIESMGGVGELIPSFMSTMIMITALMVVAYVIQGMMRLRSEESSGHLENLLATRQSRLVWAGMHTDMVIICGAVMLVAMGAGLALATNAMSDMTVSVGDYVLAGLSYVPILLFFIGLYLLLFGLLPRAASAVTWLYFGFVAFVSWLGPILQVDQWVMNLSVLEHIASPPAEDIAIMPLVVIAVISFMMMGAGLTAWHRRNIVER